MAHVLIIDDDMDVTRLLETHLTDEGHTVTVTHDAKQGMVQMMKHTPDLIMLDVFLPDATGFQMCNRIRKNDSTQTTPIIMMTGAARFPNQQAYGHQRGANEYILKPFDIVEVGELVQKYLSAPAAPAPKAPEANLEAFNAFFKRTMSPSAQNGDSAGGIEMTVVPQIPEPIEPLSAFGHIVIESAPDTRREHSNGNGNGQGHHFEAFPEIPVVHEPPVTVAAAAPAAPAPVDGYIAPSLESKERFVEFSLDIFALATRLCSTHAEKHLADQLLRTSLSMGAKLHLSQTATSPQEFGDSISSALRDLREAGYWLMLTRKLGLLEKLSKGDLEKACQSLMTVLTDSQKKR